jgi:hypothetical protein
MLLKLLQGKAGKKPDFMGSELITLMLLSRLNEPWRSQFHTEAWVFWINLPVILWIN